MLFCEILTYFSIDGFLFVIFKLSEVNLTALHVVGVQKNGIYAINNNINDIGYATHMKK